MPIVSSIGSLLESLKRPLDIAKIAKEKQARGSKKAGKRNAGQPVIANTALSKMNDQNQVAVKGKRLF